jgi:murein DD-endopeptidase MepM/ murein hydrolase activator NlpD
MSKEATGRGSQMTGSNEAASAGVTWRVPAPVQRGILPRFVMFLAAILALSLPGLANAAARPDGGAARTSRGNADYHALFLAWRQAEQSEQAEVAIPSGRPVDSANLTSGFGVRSDPFRASAAMHPGIDLAAPLGTPVYATADGIVDRSEWNDGGYGNLIEIDHGQGIQTRYGHLSQRIAQAGQAVRRGDLIGLMGSTGRSTGSHLHYEVRVAGRAIDPTPFVPNRTMMVAMRQQPQAVAEGGPRTGSR